MEKANDGMEFGLELRLARVRKHLHLYEVAQEVGISPARLSQFEGGHRTPPHDLEEKLRAALGIKPEEESIDGEAQG